MVLSVSTTIVSGEYKMPADFITQKPLHSSKVTAWCALSYRGIIGPFWFEDEDENAVTINQENYRRVV